MATIRKPRQKRDPNMSVTAYTNEYKRKTQRIYLINLSKEYHPELIAWLEKHKPYQWAIKQLICDQINREEAAKERRRKAYRKKKEEERRMKEELEKKKKL